MLERTMRWAMVTQDENLFSSSSLLIANWRRIILVFFLSRAAFPANSRASAAEFFMTAAHRTSITDAFGVDFLPQEMVNSSEGKLKSSTDWPGLWLSLYLPTTFAATRHDESRNKSWILLDSTVPKVCYFFMNTKQILKIFNRIYFMV